MTGSCSEGPCRGYPFRIKVRLQEWHSLLLRCGHQPPIGTIDLVLFSIDVLSPLGFKNLGTINHDTTIERSLRIGNFLYTVSIDQVKVHRLDDPTAQVAAVGLTPRSDDPPVYTLL